MHLVSAGPSERTRAGFQEVQLPGQHHFPLCSSWLTSILPYVVSRLPQPFLLFVLLLLPPTLWLVLCASLIWDWEGDLQMRKFTMALDPGTCLPALGPAPWPEAGRW